MKVHPIIYVYVGTRAAVDRILVSLSGVSGF
jgi:hypothetical protein